MMDNKLYTNPNHHLTQTELIRTKSRLELSRNISDERKGFSTIINSPTKNADLDIIGKKNRVTINTNNIFIVNIESFKKYNADNLFDMKENANNTKIKKYDCRCNIN